MADGAEDKYIDDAPDWVYLFDHRVHQILPLVILLLFGYLGVYFLTNIEHVAIKIVETAILGYFVLEVVLAYILYENRWAFLRDKWLNILLIIPFLSAFRVAGRIGYIANATRGLEGLYAVYAAEIPVIGRMVQQVPKLQKMGHGIIDLKKAIRKLKSALPIGLLALLIREKLSRKNQTEDMNSEEDTVDEQQREPGYLCDGCNDDQYPASKCWPCHTNNGRQVLCPDCRDQEGVEPILLDEED